MKKQECRCKNKMTYIGSANLGPDIFYCYSCGRLLEYNYEERASGDDFIWHEHELIPNRLFAIYKTKRFDNQSKQVFNEINEVKK